jgi:hypothetical protein
MLHCDLCGKEFTTPDNIPRTVLGKVFCCEDHEKKYLQLYARWLEVAYQERDYGSNHYVS